MPDLGPAVAVSGPADPKDACDLFLSELKGWAYAGIERYRDQPPIDGHDQLTYTTGWEPYLLSCRDPHVIRFLETAEREVSAHFNARNLWHHGYWRMREAHHGTEHFDLFLGFMTRVLPGHDPSIRQLLDATEHLGNWSPEVPEWFDYATGLFRSLHFGTDGVRGDDGTELNMPDHLRCATLLLMSYELTADARFLELAERYGERWATAIGADRARLPIGLTRHGAIHELTGLGEQTYRSFAGMAGQLDDDLDRAENILASGGVQLFLRLWQRSGKAVYLNAVERLLNTILGSLTDPDAGLVADAIRAYRRVTGKRDHDAAVLAAARGLSPHDIRSLAVDLSVTRTGRRPKGMGKRTDMPVWIEDGRARRHSPILLSLAAEITGDPALAACAVNLARAYFALATRLLPDGRDHGCAARTVSAVARGHGRDNHAGMTTAVLLPMMRQLGLLAAGPGGEAVLTRSPVTLGRD